MMRVEDLPDHVREKNPHLFPAASVTPVPKVEAPKPKQGTSPNRTELEYWRRLDGRGTVLFEAIKLRLGHKCWYTPDFMLTRDVEVCGTHVGRVIELHEVKGPYIHEDGLIKFKTAAARFPCFRWFLAQRKRGGVWTVEEY